MPFPAPADPNDPLVTPPGAGVGAWWARLLATLGGTWRLLLPLAVVGVGVPSALFNGLNQLVVSRMMKPVSPDASPDVLLDSVLTDLLPALGFGLLGSLVISVFTSLVWGAASWIIARWGAAQPVAVGPALAYGVRRLPRVFGWGLVVSLIVLVGVCFCVLPGLYFAFALSLALTVAVFERVNPISRSFGLTHARFGTALGRILIVVAAYGVPAIAVAVVQEVVLTAIGLDAASGAPGFLVPLVLTLVASPLYLVLWVGILVTYAELRAWEAPLTSGGLAASL
jgi:hypothetical protein